MTGRRALSDLLIEIADGVLGIPAPPGVRATAMELSLPIEVEIARAPAGPELRAELPRFVTRTLFDQMPSRLKVRWAERAAP